MQVITLDPSAFERHAKELSQMVEGDSICKFDAVVAIRRGGSIVTDAFCRYFPKERYGSRHDITMQRPSTKHKNVALSRMLKKLPTWLLNQMRIAESYLLTIRHKIKKRTPGPTVEIPKELRDMLHSVTTPHLLIIDDAIDSGTTLSAIVESLKKENDNAQIRIAVITETTRQPSIRADYSLYRNRTLIRFPWSNDYKKL